MHAKNSIWDDRQNAPFEVRIVMPDGLFKNRTKGNIYYGTYYDRTGRRRQFSTGTTNARLARQKFATHLQEVWEKENEQKLRAISLSKFTEEYLSSRRGEQISSGQLKELRSSLTFLQKVVGDVALQSITVQQCETFITQGWKATGWSSLYTAKKHYQNLSHAFKTAVRWQYIRENPFTRIKKPKPIEQLPEYLNRKDTALFYDSLPEVTPWHRRFKNIFLLVVNSGLRLGEIQNLERRDIDFKKKEIYIRPKSNWSPKSRRARVVPMSEDAVRALRSQLYENANSENERIRESVYLFPNPYGFPLSPRVIEMPFNEMARQLFPERPKLHFHSLRHTYASFLCESGVPLQEIQKILGHSTIRMTEVYARLRNHDFSNALNALNTVPSLVRSSYSTPEAASVESEVLSVQHL
jgi:site-specific recombinase XerD